MRYRCGCDPTRGQSCPLCDGTDAELWEPDAERWAREAREAPLPDTPVLSGTRRSS